MLTIFPDLLLNDLGNPLRDGTFRFDKGTSQQFSYKNLSGGEKAAFDLLLDFIVKVREFDNTVFCIDEPEAHMNMRVQGALLEEILRHTPSECQVWFATHSISMMRRARDIERANPGTVVFLDFSDRNFDQPQVMTPLTPTRVFWEKAFNVAFDDMASLIAPNRVVICEGAPVGAQPVKNTAQDAMCYNSIFDSEFPETRFLSAGNSSDVVSDRLGFVGAIKGLVSGCEVIRLIDRDDHSPADVAQFNGQGIRVLSRRHLECFLFDDEILTALCVQYGKASEIPSLLGEKADAIAAVVRQGKPNDDVKSAAGLIYNAAKRRLGLTGVGNTADAFARHALAPLLIPGTRPYIELRRCIFGH